MSEDFEKEFSDHLDAISHCNYQDGMEMLFDYLGVDANGKKVYARKDSGLLFIDTPIESR